MKMADGPVTNLPAGFDAYAGYVNRSGIGITFPQVVARFPTARHLSITTDGSRAMCADVESGAMKTWKGYGVGYCSVAEVNGLIAAFGRPRKLWTAHYDPRYGQHICSPTCWPGLVTTADGTQWTNHGGRYDESILRDDFFDTPAPPPPSKGLDMPWIATDGKTAYVIWPVGTKTGIGDQPTGAALEGRFGAAVPVSAAWLATVPTQV